MNIREEIYQYAYNKDYIKNTNHVKLGKKEALIVYIIIFIFACIFSIPILVENTILWFLVSIVSLLVLLLNAKEKNSYLKSVMNFAII